MYKNIFKETLFKANGNFFDLNSNSLNYANKLLKLAQRRFN